MGSIGSILTSVAGSIFGADAASDAAEDAASASAAGMRQAAGASTEWSKYALDRLGKMYQQGLSLQKPFITSAYKMIPYAQKTAVTAYGNLYPKLVSMATNYKTSPLTKLQLTETQDALNKQLASRGLYNSGAGVEALRKNNESIMANEADKQYGRIYNLANLGMNQSTLNTGANIANSAAGNAITTGANSANVASNLGNTLANIYTNGAANAANSLIAQGSTRSGLYSTLGNAAGSLMSLFG